MRCIVLPFGLALVAASLNTAPLRSAEPTTNEALRSSLQALFAESWDKSADGLAAAERNHRGARTASASDPRVDFSLALVQWRYLRYSDALHTLEQVAQSSPDYLPAAQARIYLLVLMKKHSTAVAQMEALNELIASTLAGPEHAAERREAVEFLGRLFGYYEGPAAGLISQATVADVRRRVLEPLATDDREAFSAAFGSVRDRFAQLDDDKRRTQSDAKDEQLRQKDIDLQRLAAERALVDADKQSVQQQADEAQKVARGEIEKIDAQITPLEADYARINAQGAGLRSQIAQLDVSISNLLTQADAAKDPNERDALRARADFLSIQARRVEIEYQALDNVAAQIVNRRNALLQQRAQVVGRYEAEAKRLGVQAAKLGRNEQRITVEQKKTLKAPTGLSPQVQDKTTTAASITTYVELPLERERLRILASLK